MNVEKINKKNRIHTLREQTPIFLMMSPFFIFFTLFTIIPIISSIVLGFTSYDLLALPEFTGLDNFKKMFTEDEVFGTVVKNTLVFAVISGPIGFLLSFVLAWFVNEFSPKVRTLLSFMFYSPSLVGNAYFIWKVLFSGESYGYLNSLLLSVGVITEPIIWLKTPEYIMPIVIIVQLWQSMGISFLSNISGLQNVSNDLYEAGAIDGIRSRWHELWYITLPSMKEILFFSAIMQIQAVFSIGTIVTTLAGYPSVNNSVDTIVSYIADVGTTRYEMGYASTISVILFTVILFFRYVVIALLKLVGKSDSK